ncbi:MAG: helix-turn-helix domain-containing protein, partial [Gorillibacterium sp.]|nr:helix-turn-helix domain-containing protein [Gorillibacterium sp.]
SNSQLTPDMGRFLFLDLHSTLLKLLDMVRLDYKMFFAGDPLLYISEVTTAAEMQVRIKDKFCEVCSFIRENRTNHSDSLYKNIVEFIENRYSDPNLDLTMIADHFNLNSAYISTFFKKQGGINLTECITGVRIEHAKRLLQEGMTVNEIAHEIGYASNIVLTKVFKKWEGITPGKYRDQAKNETKS